MSPLSRAEALTLIRDELQCASFLRPQKCADALAWILQDRGHFLLVGADYLYLDDHHVYSLMNDDPRWPRHCANVTGLALGSSILQNAVEQIRDAVATSWDRMPLEEYERQVTG